VLPVLVVLVVLEVALVLLPLLVLMPVPVALVLERTLEQNCLAIAFQVHLQLAHGLSFISGNWVSERIIANTWKCVRRSFMQYSVLVTPATATALFHHNLGGVREIFATHGAFAALKADGSVVAWGSPELGGDATPVSERLAEVAVLQICASNGASNAASLQDASIVAWGNADMGGSATGFTPIAANEVHQWCSTYCAFATICGPDRAAVTWGNSNFGGDSSLVQAQLAFGVHSIYSTGKAFAAIKRDGSVVTWGSPDLGGDSSQVQQQLQGDVRR
jgi:hypothetical protein